MAAGVTMTLLSTLPVSSQPTHDVSRLSTSSSSSSSLIEASHKPTSAPLSFIGFDEKAHSNCQVTICLLTMEESKVDTCLPLDAPEGKEEAVSETKLPVEGEKGGKCTDGSSRKRKREKKHQETEAVPVAREWRHVYVSTAIIASFSEHFKSRFSSRIKDELTDTKLPYCVTLQATTEDEGLAIVDMLRFCYTGKLEDDVVTKRLFVLCEVADKYLVPRLESAATVEIRKRLNGSLGSEVMEEFLKGPFAFPRHRTLTVEMKALVTEIEDRISVPYRRLHLWMGEKQHELKTLSLAKIGAILGSDTLELDSENTGWSILCLWFDFHRVSIQPTDLHELLLLVRFHHCTPNFFLDYILHGLQHQIMGPSNNRAALLDYIGDARNYLIMSAKRKAAYKIPFRSRVWLSLRDSRSFFTFQYKVEELGKTKQYRKTFHLGYPFQTVLYTVEDGIVFGLALRLIYCPHTECKYRVSTSVTCKVEFYIYSTDQERKMAVGSTSLPFRYPLAEHSTKIPVPQSKWKHSDFPNMVAPDGSTTFLVCITSMEA